MFFPNFCLIAICRNKKKTRKWGSTFADDIEEISHDVGLEDYVREDILCVN